mmetsp:Transcript_1206/g.3056  ORF Transcript_1206/g.3056 Transcript_1206/m.3056 type:complete len:98 (+) Transcript_1206:1063-1356(+)
MARDLMLLLGCHLKKRRNRVSQCKITKTRTAARFETILHGGMNVLVGVIVRHYCSSNIVIEDPLNGNSDVPKFYIPVSMNQFRVNLPKKFCRSTRTK